MKRAVLLLVALLGCHETVETAPPVSSATTAPAPTSTSITTAPLDSGVVAETTDAGLEADVWPFVELPSQRPAGAARTRSGSRPGCLLSSRPRTSP